MKSLLLQLYDGEVYPAEQYTPGTAAYALLIIWLKLYFIL